MAVVVRRGPGIGPADGLEPALGGAALDLGHPLLPALGVRPGAAAGLLPDPSEQDRLPDRHDRQARG
ncbi:MAG: hypothetical protein WKF40_08570 [Thermoleophilaceae bacterium]